MIFANRQGSLLGRDHGKPQLTALIEAGAGFADRKNGHGRVHGFAAEKSRLRHERESRKRESPGVFSLRRRTSQFD